MILYKNKYRIESTRLKNWDYSANGIYYITICVKDRGCVFGNVNNGELISSNLGQIAEQCWREIPNHFPFVQLDVFVVMPNHIHGVIIIAKKDDHKVPTTSGVTMTSVSSVTKFGPQSKNVASIIRGIKIGVTKYAVKNDISFQWQPRFYDHIIRDENDFNRIRQYIINNLWNWNEDEYNRGEKS